MKGVIKNKWVNIIIVAILLIVIVIAIKTNNAVCISINNEEIVLENINDEKGIDLKTFIAEKDVVIRKISGISKVVINGKELPTNSEINLGRLSINENSKIIIDVIDLLGGYKQFIINTLPSTFPKYDVEGQSEYNGDYYMTTFSFDYGAIHYIFKLDKNGNIKYYKKTDMVSFDFKKDVNSRNEIRYMYLEAKADNYEGVSSILPCELVVLNENYEEIDRIKYLQKNGEYTNLDNHTYIYIDDNHYILTTYKVTEKILDGNGEIVFDCLIQEVKDQKILWEFNSGEYPELYDYSTQKGKDYIHINSLEIDKDDGNIIVSFRNIDSIIKLNRKNGEIMWVLSGKGDEFKLNKQQKFSKQHSAISIGDNTILLYDNGNANERSRVVKLKLDETNKKVISYKEYDLGLYANMMGSVRVLDEMTETYLICYGGGVLQTVTQGKRKYNVEEIKYATQEVKFKFTFTDDVKIYNVNKYE